MKIRATPGAILLLCTLAFGRGPLFPAALLAAAFHEVGHLAAARWLGIRLRLLELDVFGARIVPRGVLPSYRAEALLAAAGPAASLLLALLLVPFGGVFIKILSTLTLSLAVFNLLPITGFDGGRVLSAVLHSFLGENAAARIMAVSTYLCLLFLFALSACLLLRFGQNMALAVLSASLFARLFLSK